MLCVPMVCASWGLPRCSSASVSDRCPVTRRLALPPLVAKRGTSLQEPGHLEGSKPHKDGCRAGCASFWAQRIKMRNTVHLLAECEGTKSTSRVHSATGLPPCTTWQAPWATFGKPQLNRWFHSCLISFSLRYLCKVSPGVQVKQRKFWPCCACLVATVDQPAQQSIRSPQTWLRTCAGGLCSRSLLTMCVSVLAAPTSQLCSTASRRTEPSGSEESVQEELSHLDDSSLSTSVSAGALGCSGPDLIPVARCQGNSCAWFCHCPD